MEQALLSPSCPPSSMPFQLKSAVVIKFQQGLGATVRRTDGGLPWHKDDTIQEDRGGQAEKEGGWQMLFIHVHCQIRTPPSSWHLKKQKMKWIFRLNRIPQWPFPQIRDIPNRSVFCICGMCGIFCNAEEDEQLGGAEFGKAGVCVCVCTLVRVCVCICVSTNVWLTEGRCLLLIHIIVALIQRLQRGHTLLLSPLSPSSISKTTQPVSP